MQISYRLVGGGAVFILVVRLVPVRSVGRLVGHTWNMNYNNNLWKWWNIPHTTAILVRPICQCHGTFPVAIVSTEWNERKISIRMVMDKFVTMTKLLRGRTISSEPKKVHREHREEKRNHFVREEIECSLCAWIYYMLLSYRFRFCIFMEVFFLFLSLSSSLSSPRSRRCRWIMAVTRYEWENDFCSHMHTGKLCILCSKIVCDS